jgi:hypothetical protein
MGRIIADPKYKSVSCGVYEYGGGMAFYTQGFYMSGGSGNGGSQPQQQAQRPNEVQQQQAEPQDDQRMFKSSPNILQRHRQLKMCAKAPCLPAAAAQQYNWPQQQQQQQNKPRPQPESKPRPQNGAWCDIASIMVSMSKYSKFSTAISANFITIYLQMGTSTTSTLLSTSPATATSSSLGSGTSSTI